MTTGLPHIIIIGGSGFIGSSLTHYLSQQGYCVTVIGRSHKSKASSHKYFSLGDYSYGDILAYFKDQPILCVIDLAYATVPNTSYADPVADFSVNLRNIIAQLEFGKALRPQKYIYISSGGTVYGDAAQSRLLTEDDVNFPLSPYGVTKMACERYVHMYHRLHGLSTVILRPSNIYGPGQQPFRGQGLIATAMGSLFNNEQVQIFGHGSNVRDYLFIEDCCSGIGLCIDHSEPGNIYNLGYGSGHSILEVLDSIDRTVETEGVALKRDFKPDRPFDVNHNVLDIQKIHDSTGWQPSTPLDVGIEKTWAWIKEYMKR